MNADASGGEAVAGESLPAGPADPLDRLDELVQAFEDHPDPNVRDAVFEMLRAVDLVHRRPLRALVALLQRSGLSERALEDR